MPKCEEYLEDLIGIEHRAVRTFCLFGAGIFFLGLAVIGCSFVMSKWLGSDSFKLIFGVGGGFVSSLSGLQIKEIVGGRSRIAVMETLKARAQIADEQERKQIEETAWKLFQKAAAG